MNVQVATENSFEKLASNMGEMIETIHQASYVGFDPSKTWKPPVNIYEKPTCLIVCVELAGMRREEIDVQIAPGQLTIRGSRPYPEWAREKRPYRLHKLEIHHGRFGCTIALPDSIDLDNTEAQYRNGYLWVRLPKQPD